MSLTYDNLKQQLKAIFNCSTSSSHSENIDIKTEPVFYLKKASDNNPWAPQDSYKSQYSQNGLRNNRNTSYRVRNNQQRQNGRENFDK